MLAPTEKVSSQWVGDYYVGEDGTYVKNQWVGDYYVGPDGKYEKNQWVGDYYVGENGKKVRNTWIDNRYLDADGKWDRTKPVPVPLEGIKVSTTGTLLKPGKTSGIDLYFFRKIRQMIGPLHGNLPMNRLQRLKTAS